MTVVTMVTTAGCWQEIHYEPSQEPSGPSRQPVVLRNETPSELPATTPSADELFAEESPPVPIEQPREEEKKDPLWVGMDAKPTDPTDTGPAPPAEIEWLHDDPEDQPKEPEATPPSVDPRLALAAWRMGSKWSLAIGGFRQGVASRSLWQHVAASAVRSSAIGGSVATGAGECGPKPTAFHSYDVVVWNNLVRNWPNRLPPSTRPLIKHCATWPSRRMPCC